MMATLQRIVRRLVVVVRMIAIDHVRRDVSM